MVDLEYHLHYTTEYQVELKAKQKRISPSHSTPPLERESQMLLKNEATRGFQSASEIDSSQWLCNIEHTLQNAFYDKS